MPPLDGPITDKVPILSKSSQAAAIRATHQSSTVNWWVNMVSGDPCFVAVTDKNGNTAYSNDQGVGGDASQSSACASQIKSKNLEVESAPTQTTTASVTTPTTATSEGGLGGADNAESTGTSYSAPESTATGSSSGPGISGSGVGGSLGSGAGVNAAPSMQLALGLLGAGLVALL
ncbi:hypothetical protein FRB97_008764 [Tulasnella sp. 331]|nr:hypothetical protein FRB97_008764 [Tulasnella sp. 331]